MENRRGKQRSAHSLRKQQRKGNSEEKKEPVLSIFSNDSDLDPKVASLWMECSNYVYCDSPIVFNLNDKTITSCMDEPTLRAKLALIKKTVNINQRTSSGRLNIQMINKCQYVLDNQEAFRNLMNESIKKRGIDFDQISKNYGNIIIHPSKAKKFMNLDLTDEDEKKLNI